MQPLHVQLWLTKPSPVIVVTAFSVISLMFFAFVLAGRFRSRVAYDAVAALAQ